jgi:hypothetical protein
MIILEPMLGLCNRIRVIDSVLAMNHERKHSVKVLWLRDPDLNCRFDELFQRPPGVDCVFDFSIATPFGRILKYILPRLLQNVVARAVNQDEMASLLVNGFAFNKLLGLRSVYIRTWDRFVYGKDSLTAFRLVPKLETVVDGYKILRQQTVGVHIRRTDNQWLGDSPTNEFVSLMKEEILHNPGTLFYVATDSPEEEKSLQELFHDRLIIHRKRSLDRNSAEGIKDAVIDLFCLARCGKIIGSHRSSFSEVAAQIGRCPLIIAKSRLKVQQVK